MEERSAVRQRVLCIAPALPRSPSSCVSRVRMTARY